ncbi:MAG: CPBP family intramembrane metalloprotease [Bacteroidales bacterium]|jgi:membrane protease YdiL (CAAX protease family)|nr:CPBP family intramembrane metalloprotease [Bacteroidales bacterium]
MRKGLFERSSPFTQLMFTLFTMLASMLLLMFVGLLLAPPAVGVSLPEIIAMTGNGEINHHLPLMRYMQTLQGIALFIVPAFFLGYLFAGSATRYFSLRSTAPGRWFVAVLFVMMLAVPLINLLASLNDMIVFPERLSWLESRFRNAEETARRATEFFMSVDNFGGMLFNIFMIAVLPGIGEELIFRGVLQKIFTRWTGNVHAAIVISAFLFSAMHLQFYGLFPRWLLGVMLGYLLVWSGSIWLPVFAHFAYNAMAVVVTWFSRKGYLPEDISEYGASWDVIPVTVILTACCVLLLWKLKIESRRPLPVEE